jgi:hypothetical protein
VEIWNGVGRKMVRTAIATMTYIVVSTIDVIKNPKINCVFVYGAKVMGRNDFL